MRRAWPLLFALFARCAEGPRDAPRDVVTAAREDVAVARCAPAPRCPSTVADDGVALEAVPQHQRLRAILARPAAEVDIAEVSLLMGQLDDPSLDIADDLATVDRIVMEFHGPGMPHLRHLKNGQIGALVEKLMEWGSIETLGRPSVGGALYGVRYGA